MVTSLVPGWESPVIPLNLDDTSLHSTSHIPASCSPGNPASRSKMLAILSPTETRLPGCQTTQPPPIKDRHPPPPPPKHLTNRTTPTITATITATTPAPPTLLTLPLKLRLQIYTHLLALHPLPASPLPADYPSPSSRSYILAPIIPLPLLSPGTITTTRPLCQLPTALLLTSRQLYLESRLLPFQTNEFSFVTWFSSGLSAARAVLAGWVAW